MGRSSQAEAERTWAAIVEAGFEAAATQGLEGISLGSLARGLGLSKSGVAGHFDNKEELQLAVIAYAVDAFLLNVWEPNAEFKAGSRRLTAVAQSWIAYARELHDQGGCFLTMTAFELAGRPGPLATRVGEAWRAWMNLLAVDARAAGLNGARTVFRLHAAITEAIFMHQLFDDDRGWLIARSEVDALLSA